MPKLLRPTDYPAIFKPGCPVTAKLLFTQIHTSLSAALIADADLIFCLDFNALGPYK